MTPPDAQERWTQRMLGGLGVRPVGHAGPADDEGALAVVAPTTATTAPAPVPVPPAPVPPAPAPRITDWWRAGRPDIVAAGPADPGKDDDQDDDDQDDIKPDDDEPDDIEPDEAKTTPTRPAWRRRWPAAGGLVDKIATDSKGRAHKKTVVRTRAAAVANDGRMRKVAFNLSAGLVGRAFGLVDIVAACLPAADHAAAVFGLVIAAASAMAAWTISGHGAVRAVFRDKTPLLRAIVTAGAAWIGHDLGAVPTDYLNAYGEKWDLGPSVISLLVMASSICGGLWWLIDRRMRGAHWIVRWLVRIPLASALLACARHNGVPVA